MVCDGSKLALLCRQTCEHTFVVLVLVKSLIDARRRDEKGFDTDARKLKFVLNIQKNMHEALDG